MKTIYEKYGELLVNYSLGIKRGDKLLVISTYLSEPLVQEVFRAAIRAGAHPETWINLKQIPRMIYDHGGPEHFNYVSPLFLYAVEHYDAFLTIRAPFNLRELQTVDSEKKKSVSMAEGTVKKLFRERADSGKLRWTLCEFPTDAQAQECGMSRLDYENFIFSACFLNYEDPEEKWLEVRSSQQGAVDFLNSKTHVRFKGKETDISFSTSGRTWINSDGRRNMPSGEIFTSPVEDSVDGHILFSYPCIYMGEEVEQVRLEVRGGKVVSWHAGKGKELLGKILEIPGAGRFGEAAIGTNNGITRFTKNILFDEKIGGTIHMALGSSYGEAGGKNQSAVHWDLITDMKEEGEIYADNELIYRNGEFLIR
jgi:aminopeptidase